ncbi:hypothetical protein MRX96_019857 [Rhipicephalus microplus]
MATSNQVTGYDPESLQIIQMDTTQTETPLPTEEEYLKDMLRVWRGRKNAAVASRDARAPAAKQQAASHPRQAQGKNAPSVTSQRAKQLQWRPKNTPRMEKATSYLAAAQAAAFRYLLLLLTAPRNTSAFRAASSAAVATRLELPVVLDGSGSRSSSDSQDWPKKAPAVKSNKAEPKKTNTGHSTNVTSGTPSDPPVLVKDFPPLTPVQAQELEAKQVGSSEPVQEAKAEDGDDGSSVTSRLTSVSRQDADTVVGPAFITRYIGRIESLEHKTEQLEASVAALPTQIMSVVHESFQDMFTAALTQALPEIVAQVSNSVLKAVQPWGIAQIKHTTQSDFLQVKRKSASRQAAEEGFSGPAPGPDRTSAP